MDTLFNSDNERRQALAKLIDPMIRGMGGRFNKDTAKAMQDYILGEDSTSIWGRLKGEDREDLVKLLNKEIGNAKGETLSHLRSIPGSNINDEKNSDVGYNFYDTRAPKQEEQTAAQRYRAVTGVAPEELHSGGNLTKAKQYESTLVPSLPPGLKDEVYGAKAALDDGAVPPKGVTQAAGAAYAAIQAYAKSHPNDTEYVKDA